MDYTLDYKKIFALAVIWWLIMFGALYLVFPWYSQFTWMKMAVAIFAGIMTYTLSAYTPLYGYSDALLFGMIFVAVGIVLDMLITHQFDPDIFTYWSLWLGYALVLFIPLRRVMRY